MDKEILKQRLTEQFQRSPDEALKAMDDAPEGQWIAASEWEVRDIFQKLTADFFGQMIQDRIDRLPSQSQAAFSPTDGAMPLRDKGCDDVRVLTADGEIRLNRRYFWAKGRDGVFPAERSVGIDEEVVPRGAREILSRLGIVQDFRQRANDARRIGNVPIGRERMRTLVEGEGAVITQAPNSGALKAFWTSSDAMVIGIEMDSTSGRITPMRRTGSCAVPRPRRAFQPGGLTPKSVLYPPTDHPQTCENWLTYEFHDFSS